MNVDSSVYDIDIEFGKLNCGDTFIYMNNLYIKAILLHSEPTEYCAVRLYDDESRCVVDVETVKLVKTKAVRDNG
ncbi:hypothetical protein [Gilliamella apicola]|uniref:Uncharacterized protein n=1 Tax=Gilliamella apicola TaxID=1196095 RepID=A0A242NEU3_9GAMM|nr:hypothetical protein [Gilliamella apicola]OTP82401.1 hypothetical protein B5S40_07070 [Gilliamella apicola]OTP84532.1 hypothetical protein B5S44_09760 [Gilliamella apicola]OTP98341.1 hypothetical protein B6D08_11400 [Gilliamella apicola]OTQ09422.1 hypothetical protein B6C91_09230 [Gilliamella apicola]OTQ13958.1 hypothetical protein B6D11_09470 [Gilliamella apicola]